MGPLDSGKTNAAGQGPACGACCRGSCYCLSPPWSPASLTQARSPYGREGKGAPCPKGSRKALGLAVALRVGPPAQILAPRMAAWDRHTEALSVSVREMSTCSREGNRAVSQREPGCTGADGTEDHGAWGTWPARLPEALLQRGRGWGWGGPAGPTVTISGALLFSGHETITGRLPYSGSC